MDDSRLLERCAALGDPVRWLLVQELRGGTRCACQLSQVAEISPSLLSYHLTILRDAGLVTASRRGRWIDYTLDPAALHELAGALTAGTEVAV